MLAFFVAVDLPWCLALVGLVVGFTLAVEVGQLINHGLVVFTQATEHHVLFARANFFAVADKVETQNNIAALAIDV